MKSRVYHKIWRLSSGWRWLSHLRHSLQRERDRPHSLACGLGVGVFASCLPLFGGQTAVGIILAIVLRGNKLCAVIGTWLSNPLTSIPIFWLNYNLGLLLLPNFQAPAHLRWDSLDEMLQQMRDISIPLGVGSVVMGILLGSITYTVSLFVLTLRKQRIAQRRQAILEQLEREQPTHTRSAALPSGKPPKIVEYNQ